MSNSSIDREVAKATQAYREEQRWMQEHGSSMAAYIERYGSKDDPEHYGDGGEAIFRADQAALLRAKERLDTALLRQQARDKRRAS